MTKAFIICVRVWFILLSIWFLGVAGLFFYRNYQVHLAFAQVDRINAAIAVLQTGSKPKIGNSLTLDDLVQRGLISHSDAYSPECGFVYCLLRVPERGQPGTLIKYRDVIGGWHIYPKLNPSWNLYYSEAAASLTPN